MHLQHICCSEHWVAFVGKSWLLNDFNTFQFDVLKQQKCSESTMQKETWLNDQLLDYI